ncbi:MAG: MerR family transcriptional regulator [Hamadaea sp.]|uniref:MerR family transcriptional regulator n=1 Tax=Hamadaea sp. TaxID=2024425 RepID=UPI00178D641D|nr:MerR family transcriptional regulator [Hamadaea sp.]NUR72342.1 MerR family transcriptional regulator [Hamadaea sp.]NUT18449.1 MerR family transcriptional regulator [Hamadaea sp.]
MEQRRWRVGELAAATGLTVRALHHFDEIGLLRAAERSSAGHRLYTPADLRRLYRIVALRQLGIPLGDIGHSLDGEPDDLAYAVSRQLEHAEAELTRWEAVRRRLTKLSAALRQSDLPVRELLDTMEVIVRERYFSDEQLARMKERHSAGFGEWMASITALDQRAAELVATEVDPSADEARELVRRWNAVMAEMSGGDRSIVARMYAKLDGRGAPEASKGLLSQVSWDYLRSALMLATL